MFKSSIFEPHTAHYSFQLTFLNILTHSFFQSPQKLNFPLLIIDLGSRTFLIDFIKL